MMLTIKPATSDELDIIRTLFREYAEWMDYKLCFDSFEKELLELPGLYAPPNGELLLAKVDDKPAGCIALKKVGDTICEMKRLWVKEEYRNQKVGISLINQIMTVAKELGYKQMRLETTPIMEKAVELYKSLGFEFVADSDGVLMMRKTL